MMILKGGFSEGKNLLALQLVEENRDWTCAFIFIKIFHNSGCYFSTILYACFCDFILINIDLKIFALLSNLALLLAWASTEEGRETCHPGFSYMILIKWREA